MIMRLGSLVEKIRRRLLPSRKVAPIGYSERLENEQTYYQDCLEVHQLPDIF